MRLISCQDAYALVKAGEDVLFVDVRTELEHNMVGHPVDSLLIPWRLEPTWEENHMFAATVEANTVSQTQPVVLICRTGQRAQQAAEKLEQIGYSNVFVVSNGFEGDLDENGHRSTRNGWRYEGLPWQQL